VGVRGVVVGVGVVEVVEVVVEVAVVEVVVVEVVEWVVVAAELVVEVVEVEALLYYNGNCTNMVFLAGTTEQPSR